MKLNPSSQNPLVRRRFLKTSVGIVAGLSALPQLVLAATAPDPVVESVHVFGPRAGYAPQVSILVSMMNWMRGTMLRSVKGMSQTDLDYLFDAKSNTIGAMLMHLAATDVVYQDLTFNNLKDFSDANKAKWGVAMNLGEPARQQIKGNNLDYYVNALTEVRQKTLDELKHRDDTWLMAVDPHFFANQPTNNYCKWFHVVEHESNHNGQIKWIRGRLPGAPASKD